MNTELRLDHNITGSNKHRKSAKDIRFTDLVKSTTCQEFNIRKQCLEHENYILQEHIMANQGMAWSYSKHTTKVLTDHKPKGTRRYDGNHVNIASFVIRFQTWQKTEHGRNNDMKASWWAWYTHHKAMHDKTSIPTARWHVYEAKHGKNNCIPCMDQLQYAWPNWITRKQSARNIL